MHRVCIEFDYTGDETDPSSILDEVQLYTRGIGYSDALSALGCTDDSVSIIEKTKPVEPRLHSYSDSFGSLPRCLQNLIKKDIRVVAVNVEPDGVFIYTNSDEWCDDNGSGTFREDTATAAIKKFKDRVMSGEDYRKRFGNG